jgi:hypothetical protein
MRRLLLALVLALPAPAAADVIAADPTARNVSSFGDVGAWSRRAQDGSHRLVVRVRGVVADAAVPPSPHAFAPDVGKLRGGARVVVYPRCRGRDCHVHQYDVVAGTEKRLLRGIAPSILNDALAFGRPGEGLFVRRKGRVRRLSRHVPVETDVNGSRIVYRSGGDIRLIGTNGRRPTLLERGHADLVLASPSLSSYDAYWLAREHGGTSLRRAQAYGRGGPPITGARYLCDLQSYAVPRFADLFVSPSGVWAPSPQPTWRGTPRSRHCLT